MKYDIIIIGGGLSGLMAGIRAVKAGLRVAIVSTGQSALHFSSGSLSLLGHDASGRNITSPLEILESLPSEHPYSKIGPSRIRQLAAEVKPLFAEAGIPLVGDGIHNHFRITPTGQFMPAWLSLDGYAVTETPADLHDRNILIANIAGFLDFYPAYIARGLEKSGATCIIREFSHPRLEKLRKSSTEMRAPNIAAIMTPEIADSLAEKINVMAEQSRATEVIIPAIASVLNDNPGARLRSLVNHPLYMVTTMPASVGGMQMQISLCKYFQRLGGDYLLGDTVTDAIFDNGHLSALYTTNLGDKSLEAEYFILATGSFFSKGLVADAEHVYESIFSIDINTPDINRSDRANSDIFGEHRFMSVGVSTDENFLTSIHGRRIPNLYAVGSVLGGCDSLKEDSGAGVAILTAFAAVDGILKQHRSTRP